MRSFLIAMFEHRLHMRAVMMLAPHLTRGNADELVAAASRKTRFEIRVLLAERFPQPDRPERLQPIDPPPAPFPSALCLSRVCHAYPLRSGYA